MKKTWLNACSTVCRWGVEYKHIPQSLQGVKVTVPKKKKLREPSFRPEEIRTILLATSAIIDTRSALDDAAKRWVPWLCAYTGARPGEMTQLRKIDVIERQRIHAIRITPEAGTVKSGEAREVPLHQHLIDQGFLNS